MQKNKYIIKNIETVFSNKLLKVFTLILLIFFGYFCANTSRELCYFDSVISSLTYSMFLIPCYMPIFILIDVLIINLFEKSSMLIIRFNNKKKYLTELIKNIFVGNTFLFITFLIIILTFFNFFSNGDLSIKYIEVFHTTNLIYSIYTIIKLYMLTIVLSITFTLILKLFNKIISLILSFIFISSLYIQQFFNYDIVDSIFKMPIFIGNYLLDIFEFKSFSLNIICLILIVIFMSAINCGLFKLTLKFMKKVGE